MFFHLPLFLKKDKKPINILNECIVGRFEFINGTLNQYSKTPVQLLNFTKCNPSSLLFYSSRLALVLFSDPDGGMTGVYFLKERVLRAKIHLLLSDEKPAGVQVPEKEKNTSLLLLLYCGFCVTANLARGQVIKSAPVV